jgi:hypothetical protein
MRSIQQRWLEATVVLSLCQTIVAFQAPHISTRRPTHLKVAGMDPNDLASLISSVHEMPSEISALLSTTFSMAPPAHSNPLFGPPDPYLAAGKSIVPSAKALLDRGITPAKTASEVVPGSSEAFQQSVQAAVEKGWKLLDGSKIHVSGANHLPGFSDTRGILDARLPPLEDSKSFGAEVKWAAGYFNVMDKLPFVAFYYALVEFFVLRPGVDLFKEEVEDDPDGVLADTISVAIVRLGVFALISMVTVLFAG